MELEQYHYTTQYEWMTERMSEWTESLNESIKPYNPVMLAAGNNPSVTNTGT